MFLVGLTGGIGSGKSTVASLLVERGAVVVDADSIARQVVAPGGVAYGPVVERFGPAVVASDKTLDRQALADIVFRDPTARADLEAITHPAIAAVMADQVEAHRATDHVVVLDIPLLKRRDQSGVEAVVVVDCPEEVAVERLVKFRNFDPGDARRRIDAQISRHDRVALADVVIANDGGLDDLRDEVERAWTWLRLQRTDPS